MHNRLGLVLNEQILNQYVIANIATLEVVVGMIRDRYQRFQISRVSQLVKVYHAVVAMLD